jgi:hypothetical protein
MEKIEKGLLSFVIVGIVSAIIIAMFISPLASGFPDGLEKVAEKLGFIDSATVSLDESFFIMPDYTFTLTDSVAWQGPLAGLFGVLIILVLFGIIYLIYRAVKRNKKEGI